MADVIPFSSSEKAIEEFYKVPQEEIAYIAICISHPNGDFTIIEGEGSLEDSGLPLSHATAFRRYFQRIENELIDEYLGDEE